MPLASTNCVGVVSCVWAVMSLLLHLHSLCTSVLFSSSEKVYGRINNGNCLLGGGVVPVARFIACGPRTMAAITRRVIHQRKCGLASRQIDTCTCLLNSAKIVLERGPR